MEIFKYECKVTWVFLKIVKIEVDYHQKNITTHTGLSGARHYGSAIMNPTEAYAKICIFGGLVQTHPSVTDSKLD